MFDKGCFLLLLFSELNDEVPLSFDPSDSVIQLEIYLCQQQ